eukprot:gene571-1100_t
MEQENNVSNPNDYTIGNNKESSEIFFTELSSLRGYLSPEWFSNIEITSQDNNEEAADIINYFEYISNMKLYNTSLDTSHMFQLESITMEDTVTLELCSYIKSFILAFVNTIKANNIDSIHMKIMENVLFILEGELEVVLRDHAEKNITYCNKVINWLLLQPENISSTLEQHTEVKHGSGDKEEESTTGLDEVEVEVKVENRELKQSTSSSSSFHIPSSEMNNDVASLVKAYYNLAPGPWREIVLLRTILQLRRIPEQQEQSSQSQHSLLNMTPYDDSIHPSSHNNNDSKLLVKTVDDNIDDNNISTMNNIISMNISSSIWKKEEEDNDSSGIGANTPSQHTLDKMDKEEPVSVSVSASNSLATKSTDADVESEDTQSLSLSIENNNTNNIRRSSRHSKGGGGDSNGRDRDRGRGSSALISRLQTEVAMLSEALETARAADVEQLQKECRLHRGNYTRLKSRNNDLKNRVQVLENRLWEALQSISISSNQIKHNDKDDDEDEDVDVVVYNGGSGSGSEHMMMDENTTGEISTLSTVDKGVVESKVLNEDKDDEDFMDAAEVAGDGYGMTSSGTTHSSHISNITPSHVHFASTASTTASSLLSLRPSIRQGQAQGQGRGQSTLEMQTAKGKRSQRQLEAQKNSVRKKMLTEKSADMDIDLNLMGDKSTPMTSTNATVSQMNHPTNSSSSSNSVLQGTELDSTTDSNNGKAAVEGSVVAVEGDVVEDLGDVLRSLPLLTRDNTRRIQRAVKAAIAHARTVDRQTIQELLQELRTSTGASTHGPEAGADVGVQTDSSIPLATTSLLSDTHTSQTHNQSATNISSNTSSMGKWYVLFVIALIIQIVLVVYAVQVFAKCS